MRYWLMILLLATARSAAAELSVFACEPEWAALARELGGTRVEVFSATTALQDPHRIEARPSLIARARRADLLVCSGAELEAGWLPMLLRQAGNDRILPGRPGHFEAAMAVERLEIPEKLDRSQGDVHAAGNPHVHLDPRRLLTIAGVLSERLMTLDPAGSEMYRRQWGEFEGRWQQALSDWEARAQPLRGVRVVVQHRAWAYLFDWLGLEEAGALEPKPGLPTSPTQLARLQEELAAHPARLIIHAAYLNPRPARWLADRTGLPVVALPFTVGGSEGTEDLFGLFEVTLTRLLQQ